MENKDILTANTLDTIPPKTDFSFPKAEHLKSERIIGALFKGKSPSVGAFPLRAVWQEVDAFFDTQNPSIYCQFAVTVPKKTFKRAHDRNFYKRIIREAYRLNKSDLLEYLARNNKKIALMVIFTGKEAADFNMVNHCMKKLFRKIKDQKIDPKIESKIE